MDLIHAIPSFETIAASRSLLYQHTPKAWSSIHKKIRNIHSDILCALLDVLLCTDRILRHTTDNPALTLIEESLIKSPFRDCIRAWKFVMSEL